jgi:hypothetical protein
MRNNRFFKVLVVLGCGYLLTNIPEEYGWLRILLLLVIVLWMVFGDKILNNRR